MELSLRPPLPPRKSPVEAVLASEAGAPWIFFEDLSLLEEETPAVSP